jgi:ABC-2 type transport system ATP-binding protein
MAAKDHPIIEVSNLQMRYGENIVLNDVNFTINKGEIVVLLGPNGAGKTTTIEILEGFRARSGGQVSVLGVDPIKGDEMWRSEIGMVLQSWRDHSRWQIRELLSHLGKYYKSYETAERARPIDTDTLLDMVGLTEHAHKRINQLSGGQRRRVDVAIGLVGNPRLLFLDEPTVGFDPKVRREFHDIIHRLADLQDTTILLTTHDLDEAEKLSDRIMILANGEIVANGSADQLARQVANKNEVIWTQDGKRHVHATKDPTHFMRKLLSDNPDGISELEIKRASLEDVYIEIVKKHEKDVAEGEKGND